MRNEPHVGPIKIVLANTFLLPVARHKLVLHICYYIWHRARDQVIALVVLLNSYLNLGIVFRR